MLRNAEHPVTDEVCAPTHRADWTRGVRGCLTWGIPAALLVLSDDPLNTAVIEKLATGHCPMSLAAAGVS
jgi:hypothetical protein